MKLIFTATEPSRIKFTLKATLSLHEWKALTDQLGEGQHSWMGTSGDFITAIQELIRKAEATYEPETEAADQALAAADA